LQSFFPRHAQLVVDPAPHPLGSLPPLYESYLRGYRLIDRGGKYKPLVYSNELTVMRQHWQAINASRNALPLELSFKPMSLKRFQWIVQVSVGGEAAPDASRHGVSDAVRKRSLVDTRGATHFRGRPIYSSGWVLTLSLLTRTRAALS
jgi:hypothetical protein